MEQNAPIGTQVGPSAKPRMPAPAPAPMPQQPAGGLGALSRQVQQDKTASLLGLLLARQYPQLFPQVPTIPNRDIANAPVEDDPLMQTLMQRIR